MIRRDAESKDYTAWNKELYDSKRSYIEPAIRLVDLYGKRILLVRVMDILNEHDWKILTGYPARMTGEEEV